MDILRALCAIPTAPFAEQYVIEYVERFARRRRKLKLSRDRWGNRLLILPGKSSSPRWVFAAHMDHPGLIAERLIDSRTLEAAFRGGVAAEYVQGSRVRFFEPNRQITGTVTDILDSEQGGRWTLPTRVRVRVRDAVASGTPGMFDLTEGRTTGKRFYSRVCDNLAGAAAALSMLDELYRKPPQATVGVLLTRAEEDGFIGAVGAATRPELLRKTDRLVVIECSAEQPVAKQGDGCIIRIGDRSSIFNSSLSYFMTHQAEELAKAEKSFKYQRALMPGGSCEATVYDIYGFVTGSICIPLGNYHNMDRAKQRIGPEYVHLDDWHNMRALFLHLARTGHTYKPGHKLLKARIEKRWKRLKHLLA